MGHDSSFLSKLAKKLFQEYIDTYIRWDRALVLDILYFM